MAVRTTSARVAPPSADGPSRHDLVLAIIPTAFVVAALLGGLVGISVPTAVGLAAVVGLLAMLDALFLNPPRGPSAGGDA